MQMRILTVLFASISLLSCNKQDIAKPQSFLNLKIEGADDAIRWETVTSKWVDSLGYAELNATSYSFDRCTISLRNITDTGAVNAVSIAQFYYTDGIDFMPNNISGTLIITEVNQNGIKGTFSLFLETGFNGSSRKKIYGDFCIIN